MNKLSIKMDNFLCHKNKSFDFSNGLTLIKGESGIGKSTIFNAIDYVITGSPPRKDCKVSFSLNDIHIERGPSSRNIVIKNGDDIIEGEEAESKILKLFGNSFTDLAYIPQKMEHSFISFSPIKRSNMLCKLLNSNTIDTYEEKSKSDRNFITNKITSLNEIVNILEIPLEPNKPEKTFEKIDMEEIENKINLQKNK